MGFQGLLILVCVAIYAVLIQSIATDGDPIGCLLYTSPITARKLGDDFDKAAVLALLTQNAHRAAEQTTAIPKYPHTQKGRKLVKATSLGKCLPYRPAQLRLVRFKLGGLDVYKRQSLSRSG